MKQNGKRYDDFKRMFVDLYNTTNHTYKSLESEYGVTATTIQRWVKDLTPIITEYPNQSSLQNIRCCTQFLL